jgi:dTDP-glucose 4,6-dehydratase
MALTASSCLESRFFADDGLWREAPVLTGQGCFDPLPDVRNILVTGGEGFIASWLVRHLVTKYPDAYRVVSFDKLDYCSSRHNARLLEARPSFHFVHGDVTSPKDVIDCLRRYEIDTIFHLAAQTHVDLSFGNSSNFVKNNVLGTQVLAESAVSVGLVKRFYHISTDEVSSPQQLLVDTHN